MNFFIPHRDINEVQNCNIIQEFSVYLEMDNTRLTSGGFQKTITE